MEKSQKRKVLVRKGGKPLIHIGHGQERPLRKHARALFMVSTEYAKRKDTFVFSENISMGGVFLETPDPLPLGTKVKLRFPLRSAYRPIQIEGKVVWSRREVAEGKLGNKASGMGIVFQRIKKGDLDVLKEFLDYTHSYGWFL